MKKVLAFFGAFNPPTAAHLELADYARRQTGREGVIFVPSRTDYIRNDQGKDAAFSNRERLEMLKILAENRPWMLVSDWELRQESQPRSYVSLCRLREEGYEPALLMGSDKLKELSSGWKYVPEIAREFGIVCLERGTDSCRSIIQADPLLRSLADRITVLETPAVWKNLSSTAVRETLRQYGNPEKELGRMVPEEITHMLNNSPEHRRNNP